jgi:hypothetical protein
MDDTVACVSELLRLKHAHEIPHFMIRQIWSKGKYGHKCFSQMDVSAWMRTLIGGQTQFVLSCYWLKCVERKELLTNKCSYGCHL